MSDQRQDRASFAWIMATFVAGSLLATPADAKSPILSSRDAQLVALYPEGGPRQELIGILTDAGSTAIWNLRNGCAAGMIEEYHQRRKQESGLDAPTAGDTCVATLRRAARDGELNSHYAEMARRLKLPANVAANLPAAVVGTALQGKAQLDLGDNTALLVKPALAFDAGFTVAYRNVEQVAAPDVTAEQLRSMTEACMQQQSTARNCAIAGLAQGKC